MNLAEPIIPGRSAAGICLGDEILPILRETNPRRIQQTIGGDVLHFDDVIVWSDSARETVNQIAVFGAYTGTFEQGLSVGMPLRAAIENLGPVMIGEDDELCFERFHGLGIETSGDGDSETISHIIVYPQRSEQGVDRKPDHVAS